jgi:hypothetical protein
MRSIQQSRWGHPAPSIGGKPLSTQIPPKAAIHHKISKKSRDNFRGRGREINGAFGELNGVAGHLPRGSELPRYFAMSLQDK